MDINGVWEIMSYNKLNNFNSINTSEWVYIYQISLHFMCLKMYFSL